MSTQTLLDWDDFDISKFNFLQKIWKFEFFKKLKFSKILSQIFNYCFKVSKSGRVMLVKSVYVSFFKLLSNLSNIKWFDKFDKSFKKNVLWYASIIH